MARTASRTRLTAAVVVGSALSLGGCTFANDITTLGPYAASDGVRVEVGDGVSVENLMVLTEGGGAEAYVLGSIVNRTREEVEVTLDIAGAQAPFTLGPGETVNLTEERLTAQSVAEAPGATTPGTVSSSGSGTVEVSVPVLDGTIPPYDTYLDEA